MHLLGREERYVERVVTSPHLALLVLNPTKSIDIAYVSNELCSEASMTFDSRKELSRTLRILLCWCVSSST